MSFDNGVLKVKLSCFFVCKSFNDVSTLIFNGYALKSIVILFEISFLINGDSHANIFCFVFSKLFNDESKTEYKT